MAADPVQGRPWVLDALDTLLAADGTADDEVVLLTGPPGAGKTTLVGSIEAALAAPDDGLAPVRRTLIRPGRTAAVHYCRARDDRSLDPLRWVRTVTALLVERVPGFAEALVRVAGPEVSLAGTATAGTAASGSTVAGVFLRHLDLGSLGPRVAFERRVVAPLELLGAGEPVLLVVDALDETLAYQESQGMVDLLAAAARSLREVPLPVRLLATSRPDRRVLAHLPHHRLDLVADAPGAAQDLDRYVADRLTAARGPADRTAASTAARVAAAAGGNFLYARLVTDELLASPARQPGSLPKSLADVYRREVERLAADPRWVTGLRPLLALLAVTRGDGLTDRTLARAAGLRTSAAHDALAALGRELTGTWPHGPFRLHHESFREFLMRDPPFPVYTDEAEAALADHLADEGDGRWLKLAATPVADADGPTGGEPDAHYVLRHAVAHLAAAAAASPSRADRDRYLDRARTLLGNIRYLEARVRTGDVDGVLDDMEWVRAQRPADAVLRGLQRVLDREAHILRRWSPEVLPALFAQLAHLRAGTLGDRTTADAAAARLTELGDAGWRFRWARGTGSAGLLRSLPIEGAIPTAVAITPDGRVCAAGDDDGMLRAWDLATGRERWRVRAHHDAVLAVAAGSDRVVSCAEDGTVMSLAVTDGDAQTLEAPGPVYGVTATAEGTRVLGVGRNGVTSWRLADGTPEAVAGGGWLPARLLGTRDGTTLLYQHGDSVHLYDFAAKAAFSYPAPDDHDRDRRLRVAAPMPDGRRLLCFYETQFTPWLDKEVALQTSAPPDLRPELRDTATGELVARLDGPTFAWRAVVEPGGTWAVSQGNAGLVVWDLRDRRAVGLLIGGPAMTKAMAASAAGPMLVTADNDRAVRVWDVREGAPPSDPPTRTARSLAIRDGRCIIGHDLGPPSAHALADGTELPVAYADQQALTDVDRRPNESQPSRSGHRRARASWHTPTLGILTLSEVTGRNEYLSAVIEVLVGDDAIATLEDPSAPITALALTADGGRVLAASWDGTVAVHRVADGVLEQRLPVASALAGVVPVTGGQTPGALLHVPVRGDTVTAMTATWDDRAVVATRDGSLQEWDLATGRLLAATILDAPATVLAIDALDETLLLADALGRVTCLSRLR